MLIHKLSQVYFERDLNDTRNISALATGEIIYAECVSVVLFCFNKNPFKLFSSSGDFL